MRSARPSDPRTSFRSASRPRRFPAASARTASILGQADKRGRDKASFDADDPGIFELSAESERLSEGPLAGELNKRHGHQAGDAVLRLFTRILRKRIRQNDLVARYGGEEFVAILEGVSSVNALRLAEDVRAAFERASVDIGDGEVVRATVSAGCAQLGDDRLVSAGLSLADVWLSQAKRGGRNQVVGL